MDGQVNQNRVIQAGLALVVLTLLGLHTAQQYFQGLPSRSPIFDKYSAVLVVLLIAVGILPDIESLKVWIVEFRTKRQVSEARRQVEQTFVTPEAKKAAETAAREATNPRKVVTEAQSRLTEALTALATKHRVPDPSRSLSELARQLEDGGAIDGKISTAVTSLSQAISTALAGGSASLGLASELEYAADLLLGSLRAVKPLTVLDNDQ